MSVRRGTFNVEDLTLVTVKRGETYRCFDCFADVFMHKEHACIGGSQVPRCTKCGGLTGILRASARVVN